MMYEGAEDFYFWLGVKDAQLKLEKENWEDSSKSIQSLENAYHFGYDFGKVLTSYEYNEMINEGVDYMKNYTQEIIKKGDKYEGK